MSNYKKVQYLGLEVDNRTFFVDLNNMVVEERKEKDGHWEVIPAKFNWCTEDGYIFDQEQQLIERK